MTYIPKVILIFQLGIIMFITGCSKDSSAPNIDELVNQEKLKAELHRIRSDRENTSIKALENGGNGLPKVESIIQQIDFSSLSKEAKAQSEKERELMNKAFSTISKIALTDASISDEQKKQILDKAGDKLRSISKISKGTHKVTKAEKTFGASYVDTIQAVLAALAIEGCSVKYADDVGNGSFAVLQIPGTATINGGSMLLVFETSPDKEDPKVKVTIQIEIWQLLDYGHSEDKITLLETVRKLLEQENVQGSKSDSEQK